MKGKVDRNRDSTRTTSPRDPVIPNRLDHNQIMEAEILEDKAHHSLASTGIISLRDQVILNRLNLDHSFRIIRAGTLAITDTAGRRSTCNSPS